MPGKGQKYHWFKPVAHLLLGIFTVVVLIFLFQGAFDVFSRSRLPEGWEIIRPPDEVTCLLIHDGQVWTGGKDGVMVFNSTTRERIPLPDGPPLGYIRAFAEDTEGGIWIAHDYGLVRFIDNGWENYGDIPQFPSRSTSTVLVDRNGSLWVGSSQELVTFNGLTWTTVAPPGGWMMESIDVLFMDRDGTLWIGSSSVRQGGLYSFNGSGWTRYTLENGLPHPKINMITQSRDGTLWIATGYSNRGGLVEIRNGTWKTWTTTDGLAADNTRSVFEDSKGRLWIGSESKGLVIMDQGDRYYYTDRNGLAGSEVKMVKEDEGVFWIGTSGGLSRIEEESLISGCGCS
jgi:ligand-binding sensor domain-containing protein